MGAQSLDYQFDGVEVKRNAHEVLRDGKQFDLEPKAFRVLLYLIENRDRAVGKDELIDKVWEGVAVTDNALSRIVAQLRKELGDDAKQSRYIQTLPTIGYRFVAELSSAEPCPALPEAQPQARRRWRLPAAAGIVILLGAAAAHWYPQSHPPEVVPGAVARPIQLTTSPGLDLNGSFNPDDSALAYSSNRSGHFEIYLHPLDSRGHERQVTFDGQENFDPAWSPDGSSIAFYSVRRHGIWIVPVTGGPVRQIAKFGTGPVWSPDGQHIAFASGSNNNDLPQTIRRGAEIWMVAADGSGLRRAIQVAPNTGDIHSFCWWPDGKRLLLTYRNGLSLVSG